jgi:hypothetical protein
MSTQGPPIKEIEDTAILLAVVAERETSAVFLGSRT